MVRVGASVLSPELVVAGLAPQRIPREVVCYEQVSSTMDIAREYGVAGAPEGVLVLAEAQTAGRGRMGRLWASPPGDNLYMSLLLRPPLPPSDAFSITMLVAVALCRAVEATTQLVARLKWPNDLLLPSSPDSTVLAKAAGILVELSLRGGQVDYAIVGCGINVNSHPPVDAELRYAATSVAAAAGHAVDRVALLHAFVRALDAGYAQLHDEGPAAVFAPWRQLLVTIGSTVAVDTPAGRITGVAEDVTASGALIVRDDTGVRRVITTGDVQA